ncbi:YbjN domain-containing protein [Actinoplanes sp. CA-142083]|uniref:YbjN domain-containing protein n=1 Tax=Actinoplanes sp. CA-142083 TaxID=3239903 RepID=UPI003D8B5383
MTDDFSPPGDAIERPPSAEVARPAEPDDFYVTLQPLTLELLAHQLTRLSLDYEEHGRRLYARFAEFTLQISVLNENDLSVRAILKQQFPASAMATLTGRCNWWNASQLFVKASATTIMAQADAGSAPAPAVRVQLDLDLPCPVGVAPVQLQALLQAVLNNVNAFKSRSRVADLAAFGWG